MPDKDYNEELSNITHRMDQLESENATLKAQLAKQSMYTGRRGYYEYKSEASFMGLPLVHIAQGFNPETGQKAIARGIFAVGDIAIGVFSLGGLSAGVFSLGGVSLGLILAIGGVSIGGAALGGLAIGYFAIGGMAIGQLVSGGGMIGTPLNFEEIQKYLFDIRP
jgi:hypothetical protein